MARVHRADFAGPVRGIIETPQGGARVPAVLTRTGVLPYEDAQGNRWRELRPADEVFAVDSLASLRDAPVTVLHPPGLVTRDNWDDVAVGHNGGAVSVEADRLVVTDGLVVQSAGAVDRVRSGELCETSAGYTCDIDEAPGNDPVDGPYDKVQRRIRYNHVALGPAGWARGGREMALRMDGGAAEVRVEAAPAPATTTAAAATGSRNDSAGDPAKDHSTMIILTIKGRKFRADAEAEMAEAQKTVDALGEELAASTDKSAQLEASLDAASKALVDAVQTVAGIKAELAAAKAPAADKPVAEDDVPEAVQDSIAQKRLALRDRASAVLPATVKLEGLSAAEIRAKTIAHALPAVKLDGLDAKTVDGMFHAVTETAVVARAKREDGQRQIAAVLAPTGDQADAVKREDGEVSSHTNTLQSRFVKLGQDPLTPKAG